MRNYITSLNRIFKTPFSKAMIIIMVFISFLFVGMIDTSEVKADLDYCTSNGSSGFTMYVNDNGDCKNSQWNSHYATVSSSATPSYTTMPMGSAPSGVQSALASAGITNPNFSFWFVAAYNSDRLTVDYGEVDHCTGSKYIKLHNGSSWSTLNSGGSYTITTSYTVVVFYSVNTCNIIKDSGATMYNVIVVYRETKSAGSISVTSGSGSYVSGSKVYYSSTSSEFIFSTSGKVWKSITVYDNTHGVTLGTATNSYWYSSGFSTSSGWYYVYFNYANTTSIKITVTSISGVTYSSTYTIVYDISAPSASVGISGADSLANFWTNSQKVYADLIADDSQSGFNSMAIYDSSGNLLLGTTSSSIYTSFNLPSAAEGEHTVVFVVCDNVGNCASVPIVLYLDKTNPIIDEFTMEDSTTGTDGYKYTINNSFDMTLEYSDDMGISTLIISSICNVSGTIIGLTTDYPSFAPTVSCDISSYSISYTTQRSLNLYIYDFAGNCTTVTIIFYKIDTTRKVSITSFNILGKNALAYNWVGPESLTNGYLAPVYSLSNTTYMDDDYMYLEDVSSLSLGLLIFKRASFVKGTRVSSGTYVSLGEGNILYFSTEDWYAKISHGKAHTFSISFKNIYGQTTSASVTVRFDFTTPTSPSISNTSGGNWTNQDVTLTPSGSTDSGSGVYAYKYGIGTTTTSSSASSLKLTSEQDQYYYFRAYDAAGNYSSVSSTRVRIDKTKPTMSSISNTSGGNWTNQNVTLTPTGGADTGTYQSGFTKYQYSTNNSSWSNSLTTSFSSEQNSTYYYRPCDVAGNCGTSKSATVKIDKTAPTGTITLTNTSGGSWTNQNVYITARGAYDPLSNNVSSGLKQYDWSSGSGWTKFYSQSNITDQTNGYAEAMWSGETDFTLTTRVCDNAGNCMTGSTTTKVRIDKTVPSSTISISNSSSGNWTNQNIVLKITGAADTGTYQSGPYKMQYSYDQSTWNEDWDTDSTISTVKGTWVAERDVTVYFRLWDNAGNVSAVSSTTTKVRIDKTNPTFTLSNSSGGSWTNQNVSLTPSGGKDTGTYKSGFSHYQYSTNNSSWTTVTTGKSYSAEQNSTYYFRACDVAGNCYSRASNVKIDKTNPSQPSITNSSSGNWTNQNVTLTATGGADTGTYQSGFSHYQYSTNNSSWSTLSTTTYTEEQNNTYYYRACDAAGNCSSSRSSNVKIDKTAPVASISVNTSAKTATITITDKWSIADSQSKLGSNYKYYLSKELNLTATQLKAIPDAAWLSPLTTGNAGTTIPMNVSSGKYYLYIRVSNAIKDSATNTVTGTNNNVYTTSGNYVIYRKLVEIDSGNYGDGSSSFDEASMNSTMNGSIANLGAQVYVMDRVIMVTFAKEKGLSGFTMSTINSVLQTAGYTLVTIDRSRSYDFEGSYVFEDVLIAKLDSSNKASEVELMDLIVIITAPQVKANNAASVNTIEVGGEVGNVAVSFVSDVEFKVETEIIHDGVKVSKIDTNKPGIYEVRHTAVDVLGRINRVQRTLIVKEDGKEEIKEEVKETIEVKEESVVVNETKTEVQQENNSNRKVVENIQVEMMLENKEELNGYKNEKEAKAEQENSLTFKLFSKWFFKVYDG